MKIRFRAKSLKDGNEIYGFPIIDGEKAYIVNGVINASDEHVSIGTCGEVDPTTIEQFTNWHTVDGEEIYQNDIVSQSSMSGTLIAKGRVSFIKGQWVISESSNIAQNYPLHNHGVITKLEEENILMIDKMNELNELVAKWAIKKHIHTTSPEKQILKIYEEFGEICGACLRKDNENFKMELGDLIVALNVLHLQLTHNQVIFTPIDWRKSAYIFDNWSREEAIIELVGTIKAINERFLIIRNNKIHLSSDFLKVFNSFLLQIFKFIDKDLVGAYACYKAAYDKIKSRETTLIDGVLIKNEDLEKKEV
ncbi:hypothetical protein [Streptococcus mutans]|uniref:hypothetical protein n=1 Tax=Streptococcus mutans TaxID=1309 RepID=UPI0015E1B60D|nr:hypothetical protein [Streptococcus mutans]